MSEPIKRHPLNVGGGYYVDLDRCANHESCVYYAPNNFVLDPSEHYGAYVVKQPDSTEEEEQCRQAMDACPEGAIRIEVGA